jgi:hypothetical protein
VSRKKLSPQQWARLAAEPRKGPLAYGFVTDQRWTLGRIKTLIGRLCHVEGIWPLLKRSMTSFVAADQAGLVRIIKRKLNKIQYRPHLINGRPAATGLRTGPW